jgi:hypothetical protein
MHRLRSGLKHKLNIGAIQVLKVLNLVERKIAMPYVSAEEARRMESKIAAAETALAVDFPLQVVSLKRDPAWLRLPIAKKEIGLKRLRVMLEYDREKARTKAEAQAAADEIGMKLRSFYALHKLWRDSNRSRMALVPYAAEVATRRSRLGHEVSSRLTALAQSLVASAPTATPGALLPKLRELWGDGVSRPSDVTFRSYLERAREEHRPQPGSISAESLGYNKQPKADGFGDVLIIDHTAPADILTHTSRGIVAPTVTLVLDEYTGSPVGAACHDGSPSADLVLAALADAQKRLARLAPACSLEGAGIVYSGTFDREWRGLSEDLLAAGYFVNERIEGRLSVGHAIRQLIGTSLDEVPLHSGRAVRKDIETEIDPEHKALLPLKDVRVVIEDAVDKVFEQRVPISERHRDPSIDEPPVYKSMQLRGEFTGDLEPDWKSDDIDEALQRAREEHLWLQMDRGYSPRIAAFGHGFGRRSPGVFRRQIERLVREVAEDSLVSIEIVEPNSDQPSWDVKVIINDAALRTPIWLEFAREAIDLADVEFTFVHFTVDVAAGTVK